MYRQFKLKSETRELICYLLDDVRLKEKVKITLDDVKLKGIIWTIIYRSKTTMNGKPHMDWKVSEIL